MGQGKSSVATSRPAQDAGLARDLLREKRAILHALSEVVVSADLRHAFLLPSDAAARGRGGRVCTHPACDVWQERKRKAVAAVRSGAVLRSLAEGAPEFGNAPLIALILLEAIALVQSGQLTWDERNLLRDRWVALADRFGLWKLRYELEDALFRADDPETFALVTALLRDQEELHFDLFQQILSVLRHHLMQKGLGHVEVLYRKKNVFGVHQKMMILGRSFSRITDLFGFRIIAQSEEECYRVTQLLHWLWRQFPERHKDYIASPKPNGYRSIHTTVVCLHGSIVEFQVRTREMETIADSGSASHAHYKARTRQRAGRCLR